MRYRSTNKFISDCDFERKNFQDKNRHEATEEQSAAHLEKILQQNPRKNQ